MRQASAMARALRIDIEDGLYHATSCGSWCATTATGSAGSSCSAALLCDAAALSGSTAGVAVSRGNRFAQGSRRSGNGHGVRRWRASLEMRVVDLFRFNDDRTGFVGPVKGDVAFLGQPTCRLVVNGIERAIGDLVGEMIPDRIHPEGHRAVSTQQSVPLTREDVHSCECWLRSCL